MWDRRVIPMAVAIIAGVFMSTHFAAAQDDFYPPGGRRLRITITHLNQHVEAMGLTEAERDEALEVLDFYTERFDEAHDDWLRCYLWISSNLPSVHSARDASLDAAYYEDEHLLLREWQSGVRELEQWYFDQLSDLFPQQRDRVGQLHETHVRQRVLAAIDLLQDNPAPGAQLDLTELFAADDATNNQPVDELLNAYKVTLRPIVAELDERLWRYRRAYRAPMRALRDAEPDGPDLEQRIAEFEDIWITPYRLRWRIYELNRRTLSALLAELSVDRAREMREIALPKLYPYAYENPEDIARTLDDRVNLALRRNDLTTAQMSAITDVRAALNARRGRFIERAQDRYADVHGPQYRAEQAHEWVGYLVHRKYIDSAINAAAQRDLDTAIREWTTGLADLHAAVDAIVADANGDGS